MAKKQNVVNIKFEQKLILNKWILKLFEISDFDKLTDQLKSPDYEGFTENNVSKFHLCLCSWLFDRKALPFDLLAQYDQNIVRYWKQITEKRNKFGHTLYPKYFQYLALLFTEIYLDRYFSSQNKLLTELNTLVNEENEKLPKKEQINPFFFDDLNKIAFWMATGSGKTLLMHINILQYKHYLIKDQKQKKINKIILLTPNEGLSYQHLNEFQLSGLKAEIFSI